MTTLMERPEQVGEVSEESVWGEVAARSEGRRLCQELGERDGLENI